MTALASLPDLAARFGAALRAAGIACDPGSLRAYATALGSEGEPTPFGLYWYARITLLRSIEDLPAFNRAFGEFFAGEAPLGIFEKDLSIAIGNDGDGGGANEDADVIVTASSQEHLRERDFADFTDAEWREAERLMRAAPAPEELRPSRRVAIRRHGRRLDVAATLREELRTFGMRLDPRYRVRKRVLRPLVFLCDVSGSMAPYGRALLQYAYVLARTRPKVSAFAFGTRLTNLTETFARRRTRRGFDQALRTIPDWGGGTLIGASLRTFNQRFAMNGAARGATVVLVSDGCERDDPELVGREMAQLARSARRIVWVNPLKSDPAYEPLVRGMAAALPSIDVFLPGHNLRSLDAVAARSREARKFMIITDSFDVEAPLDKVWALLTDVPRVAPCIPNARITEVVDDRTYKAEISMRVGPVSVSYKATIVIEKIDDATHSVEMNVRGNEGKGRGDVNARVVSKAEAKGDKTHVTLETNATMTGIIATVGGRLIEGVAKATTAKFAQNLAKIAAE